MKIPCDGCLTFPMCKDRYAMRAYGHMCLHIKIVWGDCPILYKVLTQTKTNSEYQTYVKLIKHLFKCSYYLTDRGRLINNV